MENINESKIVEQLIYLEKICETFPVEQLAHLNELITKNPSEFEKVYKQEVSKLSAEGFSFLFFFFFFF